MKDAFPEIGVSILVAYLSHEEFSREFPTCKPGSQGVSVYWICWITQVVLWIFPPDIYSALKNKSDYLKGENICLLELKERGDVKHQTAKKEKKREKRKEKERGNAEHEEVIISAIWVM